jgi:hypothetical protein
MRDLKTGARVRWMDGDRQLTGTACGPARNKVMVSVRVDAGGMVVVAKNRLRPARDEILILESRLQTSLRTGGRQCGDLFAAFLQGAHQIRPLYDRVNTSADLNAAIGAHANNVRIVVVSAHGIADKRGTRLELSRDDVHLRRDGRIVADQPWLQALAGKIVILSACELAADGDALSEIAKRNRIELLVAYADTVYDSYAHAAEILLLQKFIEERHCPQLLISRVRAIAEFLHRNRFDHVHPRDRAPGFRKPLGPVMRVFGPR